MTENPTDHPQPEALSLAPVVIYVDGACMPNPGAGGYGVIVDQNGQRKELSGGVRKTTNNRMEILAAIEGIKGVETTREGLDIIIYSDSRYVGDMFNGGNAKQWRANGWMRNHKERAKNEDLWGQLLDLAKKHRVRFEWVKGHSEHPENERCDQLAVEARQRENLPSDDVYENPPLTLSPPEQLMLL